MAFCHLFDKLLQGRKLAGIDTEVHFLGVFDVVASVGGSASVAKTLPLPGPCLMDIGRGRIVSMSLYQDA